MPSNEDGLRQPLFSSRPVATHEKGRIMIAHLLSSRHAQHADKNARQHSASRHFYIFDKCGHHIDTSNRPRISASRAFARITYILLERLGLAVYRDFSSFHHLVSSL